MKHRCIDFPELERSLDWDPLDPRRRSLAECPRCQARVLSYLEFLDDATHPAQARVEEAATRTRKAFQQELSKPLQRPGTTRARGPSGGRRSMRRPVWAVAATLLLALGVAGSWQMIHAPEPTDRLREAANPGATESTPVLLPTEATSDGGLVLRWSPALGATAYAIRLMDADLADVARLGPVTDTLLVLRRENIPAGLSSTILGWQVLALREGREIAASAIGTLRAP